MIVFKKNGKYQPDTEITHAIRKYLASEWLNGGVNKNDGDKSMLIFPEKIYFHEAGFTNKKQVLYKTGKRYIDISDDVRGTAKQCMRIEMPSTTIMAQLSNIFYYTVTKNIIINIGVFNDNTMIVINDFYICAFFEEFFKKMGLLK